MNKLLKSEFIDITEDTVNNFTQNFLKDGFVEIKKLFSPELIMQLNAEFQKNYRNYFQDINHEDAYRVGDKRFQITVDVTSQLNNPEIYANNLVLRIIKKLIIDELIISDITCVTSLPGSQKMKLHRDGNIFIGNPIAHLLPPHAIGLLIPLIPFTAENGPTRYWPTSHKNNLSVKAYENNDNYYDAVSELGDAILMDYRTVHLGLPNNSEQIRPLLYINYAANWYFDPNNFHKQSPLKVSDENFQKIPDNLKPMFIRKNIYKNL